MQVNMTHALSPEELSALTDRMEKKKQKKKKPSNPTVVPYNVPLPNTIPVLAQQASEQKTKPLFKRCIDLIAALYTFPLFEFYLFPDGLDEYIYEGYITEPVDVLWNCFKLGAPLCVVYNELAVTTTGEYLEPDDVFHIRPPLWPSKPCKANLYKFIAACHGNDSLPSAKDLGGVSELYKDEMDGFLKFLTLVEDIVEKIRQSNNMPVHNDELPFLTELAKEFLNPLDNRSRLIKELIETERSYIASLELLQKYQNEVVNTKALTKEMMSILFSNLNELLDFQRRFMVAMEGTLHVGVTEHRLGQLFLLNEEAFEVYFPFCINYQTAQDFAASQDSELSRLDSIIPHHQLPSFLIQPIQRLMRYPLLLKELIKLTDPEAYPYIYELKEGLESIKRVTEKLNEVQRRDDNEKTKLDLFARMDNWQGLSYEDFGSLLLTEKFTISASEQDREYHLFLFERILLCCKKQMFNTPAKKVGMRKKSDAGKEPENYLYQLRGNIYVHQILRVEDSSDPNFGLFSISVHWRETSQQDAIIFSLRCRNEEQVVLWTDRLQKQVDVNKLRQNIKSGFGMARSASNPGPVVFNYSYGSPQQQQFVGSQSNYQVRPTLQQQFGTPPARNDSMTSISSMPMARQSTVTRTSESSS
ncbi:UNVERIFIED_CONTAM: hypothetical protein HDU68_011481, partial [Siphonaria sp. JEL0065]